jgi:hypothetical protein
VRDERFSPRLTRPVTVEACGTPNALNRHKAIDTTLYVAILFMGIR